MASAKWLARIGAAMGRGTNESKACTCGALKDLPPPGHVMTSSGIIVPVKHMKVANGSARGINMDSIECAIIEKMERGSGLFFRFSKVLVTIGACCFVLNLTWYEVTEKGRLQYYLPGPSGNTEHTPPVALESTLGFHEKKNIMNEVDKEMLAEFSEGCIRACESGELLGLIDTIVVEHKLALISKGLPPDYISHAQDPFFRLLRAAAKSCMLQSYKKKQESPANEQEEEDEPPK